MAGRYPISVCNRFVEKCEFNGSDCIEWIGHGTRKRGDPKRYGVFSVGRKIMTAHRWLYEQIYGTQLAHIDICHICDNRLCVNIDHLFAGTRKENMEDAVRKGRMSRVARTKGESHPMAVLSTEKIKEIRAIRQMGAKLRELAFDAGVSIAQISRIINNQSWKE